ncbi:MAG TPA: hypothetical protein VHG69_02865 [Thermoleophilaceae bacterium]|nr:hypothetical protein [Thermoleophilaceae bacterium]
MKFTPLRGLVAIRGAIGLSCWFAPEVVASMLQLRTPLNEEVRYVCRIWGARNITLAAGTAAAEGSSRRALLEINIAIDLVDLVAGALFVRARRPGMLGYATSTLPAAAAAALGIAARSASSGSDGLDGPAGVAQVAQ